MGQWSGEEFGPADSAQANCAAPEQTNLLRILHTLSLARTNTHAHRFLFSLRHCSQRSGLSCTNWSHVQPFLFFATRRWDRKQASPHGPNVKRRKMRATKNLVLKTMADAGMAANSPGAAVDEAVGRESGSVHVRIACVPLAVALLGNWTWAWPHSSAVCSPFCGGVDDAKHPHISPHTHRR
jgi:hypothetical protein